MTDARDQRNPRIIDQLNALGFAIDYEEVVELAHRRGSSIVSRPHIAQIMTDKGYTDSVIDAFNRYLGEGAPAYVPRERLAPRGDNGRIWAEQG